MRHNRNDGIAVCAIIAQECQLPLQGIRHRHIWHTCFKLFHAFGLWEVPAEGYIGKKRLPDRLYVPIDFAQFLLRQSDHNQSGGKSGLNAGVPGWAQGERKKIVLPLGDESHAQRSTPLATISLIILSSLVFALELQGGDNFIQRWSLIPAHIVAGRNLGTIVSSMFLHGSWSHILGNMIYFWAFAPPLEDLLGSVRLLFFYFLGGVVAMAAQIAGDPSSTVPCLGASGAIAAVMGGFLVTFPRDRIRTVIFLGFYTRIAFVPALILIGFWFILQLISVGSVSGADTQGGVAYLAHIGGFIFGAATIRLFGIGRGELPG